MGIKTVKKQNWEAYYLAGSILEWQEDDSTEVVTLVGSTVVAEDADGTDVSDTFMEQGTKRLDSDLNGDFDDNMLSMRLKGEGGDVTKSPYIVTFRITTDEGNQYEVDYKVEVKEIP